MIRFACPGCKSVLAGRDEHAGKIVMCPKCGQRMQSPRPPRMARENITYRRRRPLIAGILLVGVLLLAGGVGGIWLWTHPLNREPELSTEGNGAATVRERPTQPHPTQPLPDGRGSDRSGAVAVRERPSQSQPEPNSENRAATVRERPSQPLATARGSDKLSPVKEEREIDLADDLPPELSFDLVDAINVQRTKAGVEPIFLDVEVSRACQSRAEQLARHAGLLPRENGEMESVAQEAPLSTIEKWLKEPKRRAAILEPRLRTFGAGFARNVDGQWISVFDWTGGIDREPPLDAAPVTEAIVYPAPGQRHVPLWFPDNETPDPLPETKEKLAGFPVTLTFPPRTRIENVAGHLSNKETNDISVWLSSPEHPANPQFAGSQQNTICLIARKPLCPNTRYHVEVSATVNGTAWSAKWDFATVSEGEIHQEMAGTFVRMLNGLRRRAGLPPVPLDAERSKDCAAHARYLGRNVPDHPALNWNDEKPDLPGYTTEGAAVARTAAIQGGGGPIEAVAGLIDSLISRPQLLDPCLRGLGLGYTPFIQGGWIWVIDLHRSVGRISNPSSEAAGRIKNPSYNEAEPGNNKEYFYPAPDQASVPLVYPPNEVPSPVPARSHAERGNEGRAEEGLAGYAITVLFGPRAQVTAATVKLVDDKGAAIDGWFSTPENPAIAGFPQSSLCFLPKMPLRSDTPYTATFQAEVNGKPWRRTWSFTTLKEPDRYSDDLEEKIAARVNAVRKAAGLSPVRLDAKLSGGCQSHARYLSRNHRRPEVLGMGMHRQDADLPGASPQGARAAKESVIAVVLDPQTCVENWMATLYHRIPILAPNLERIGFGHAHIQGHKWVCVLDTGNGRTPKGRDR